MRVPRRATDLRHRSIVLRHPWIDRWRRYWCCAIDRFGGHFFARVVACPFFSKSGEQWVQRLEIIPKFTLSVKFSMNMAEYGSNVIHVNSALFIVHLNLLFQRSRSSPSIEQHFLPASPIHRLFSNGTIHPDPNYDIDPYRLVEPELATLCENIKSVSHSLNFRLGGRI
jgi:hypothetical protein